MNTLKLFKTHPRREQILLTNLAEMLTRRQCTLVPPYSEQRQTLENDYLAARTWYTEREHIMSARRGEDQALFHVIAIASDKISIQEARRIATEYPDHIILVAPSVTPYVRNFVQDVSQRNRMEFFTEPEILRPIVHHQVYYSPHTLIPKDQEVSVLQSYHLLDPKVTEHTTTEITKAKQRLQRLLRTDPVCRYFNFGVGRIVRIERTFGGLLEKQVVLRLVAVSP